MSKVLIVIVNWNSKDRLRSLFASLDAAWKPRLFDVVVQDNDSEDDSMNINTSDYSFDLKLNFLGENLGFGKACNRAITKSDYEYYLFLNPDTKVKENTIQDSYNHLQKNKNINVLGIKLENEDEVQRGCSRVPSYINLFWTVLGLSKVFPKWFLGINMTENPHDKSMFVDHVIGAYYMIRSENFHEVGGFDEEFFLYFEDLDLSARLKKAGKRIFYWADISAFHEGGGTSKQIISKRTFYSLRSRTQYVKKHTSKSFFIMYWLLQYSVEFILRLALASKSLKLKYLFQIVRVYWDLFKDPKSGLKALI
jgi:GT2 family glycosyltransferase